jgi:DNA-binding NarL/FixJ family response regulator
MALSYERAALIQRLATLGYPDDRVAHLLNISQATVKDVTRRASRDAEIRAAAARGEPVRKIAENFHLATLTVRRIAGRA